MLEWRLELVESTVMVFGGHSGRRHVDWSSTMNALARAIAWPIVTLLVIGASHLAAEAIRPELHDLVGPAAVMPIYLAIGGWAGFSVVRAGGTFVHALVAGALLGLLPAMLQLVGFGVLLGRDGATVTTSALFGLAGMFWGGTIGGGVAASTAPERVGVGSRDLDARSVVSA